MNGKKYELARIEEASHAIINLLTTKRQAEDQMTSIRVTTFQDGSLDARVDTDPQEITGWLLSQVARGGLLADMTEEKQALVRDRINAKLLIVIGGQAGVDLYLNNRVQHVLLNYNIRAGWYEDTVKVGRWLLRDADKALLFAYFLEVNSNRIIATDSPADWDFLRPISDAYATDHAFAELVDDFICTKTGEAVTILDANWNAVLALATALEKHQVLPLIDVLQVLDAFPAVVGERSATAPTI